MSLGKIAIFAAGTVVGGIIGYAATRSKVAQKATKSAIKAGLRAKEWTAEKYDKAKENVTAMVKDARKDVKEAEA